VTSIADGSVIIQSSSESVPSTPSWFGEVVLLVGYRRRARCPDQDQRKGAFCAAARRLLRGHRFSRYPLRVCQKLRTHPGGVLREAPALCGPLHGRGRERDRLPARSTLSRFLAALTEAPVEALRTLFLDDLESRPLSTDSNGSHEKQTGGLVDRAGNTWVVFDIDGTGEAARVSCLAPDRRLAPGLIYGWMRSVPLATGAASVGKWCGRVPSKASPTVESRLGS